LDRLVHFKPLSLTSLLQLNKKKSLGLNCIIMTSSAQNHS
jgi:hypothetical protein